MFRGPGLVVEPARPAHGRDARRAGRPPRPHARPRREGRRLGAQLAPGRRPRDARWASAASGTSASSCASATARDAVLVGFTTYDGHRHGRLRLGRAGRAEARPPGAAGQLRGACSTTSASPRFLLDLPRRRRGGRGTARSPRLERAIGVIYRPETERQSHYFHAAPARPVRRGDPLRRDHRRRRRWNSCPAGTPPRCPKPSRAGCSRFWDSGEPTETLKFTGRHECHAAMQMHLFVWNHELNTRCWTELRKDPVGLRVSVPPWFLFSSSIGTRVARGQVSEAGNRPRRKEFPTMAETTQQRGDAGQAGSRHPGQPQIEREPKPPFPKQHQTNPGRARIEAEARGRATRPRSTRRPASCRASRP